MNEIFHFLTGYLIARGFKYKEDRFAVLFTSIAALIPDIDLVLGFFISMDHATWTHTIIFSTVMSVIYASVVYLIGHRWMKRMGLTYKRLLMLALIANVAHLAMDICTYHNEIEDGPCETTFRHLYFWPLWNQSFHLNCLGITDSYLVRTLIEVFYGVVLGVYIIIFQWIKKKENPFKMFDYRAWGRPIKEKESE